MSQPSNIVDICSKYPMPTKQRKRIRVEQLRKISINEIIYSGSWIRQFGDTTVELIHHHDGIRLSVNGCLQPICWRIYERTIRGKLANGGYIPIDKYWDYYIYRAILLGPGAPHWPW